jgi:rare lipoprotein A
MRLLFLVCTALLLAACAGTPQNGSLKPGGYSAVGTASWYGSKHHGRKTASGERFNQNALTAAHRKLPFGSRVKVTNLANQRSVVVRINDRGPFSRGRLIDVSRKAAEQLGMLERGTAKVRLEALSD